MSVLPRRNLANISTGTSVRWRSSSGTPSVLHGHPDGVEQGIAPERLCEEGGRACLQGSLARLAATVRCQHDGGNGGARGREMPEEIEAAHPAHSHIEHQAAGLLAMDRAQELFGRRERLGSEAD